MMIVNGTEYPGVSEFLGNSDFVGIVVVDDECQCWDLVGPDAGHALEELRRLYKEQYGWIPGLIHVYQKGAW